MLALTCEDPVSSFITLMLTELTKMRYFGNVLESMVPLVFSGLACSLLFRTGLFNLGIEGIYYIGGVICSYIACQAFWQHVYASAGCDSGSGAHRRTADADSRLSESEI